MTKKEILPLLRPTYAKIDLTALKVNLLKAKDVCANKNIVPKIMLLVKANAYGHGADLISLYAQKNNLCEFIDSIDETNIHKKLETAGALTLIKNIGKRGAKNFLTAV